LYQFISVDSAEVALGGLWVSGAGRRATSKSVKASELQRVYRNLRKIKLGNLAGGKESARRISLREKYAMCVFVCQDKKKLRRRRELGS
jgi:hypothetical protein